MAASNGRTEPSVRQKLTAFLVHWLPHAVVVAIGPALFAAAALTTSDHLRFGRHHKVGVAPTLIVLGVILLLLASWRLVRRQRRLDVLEGRGENLLRRAEGSERALVRLARAELNDLRLRLHHYSNERMSLFRCDGNAFTLVARFSANPVFDRSEGRDLYPIDEGVLGQAWRDGTAYVGDLPPAGDGEQPTRGWVIAQGRLGVPEAAAAGLTMRSRLYCGVRIEGPDGPLGVVLAESVISADEAAQLAGTQTVLGRAGIEGEAKAAADRLARALDASRGIAAHEIRRARHEVQEHSFGVFRGAN